MINTLGQPSLPYTVGRRIRKQADYKRVASAVGVYDIPSFCNWLFSSQYPLSERQTPTRKPLRRSINRQLLCFRYYSAWAPPPLSLTLWHLIAMRVLWTKKSASGHIIDKLRYGMHSKTFRRAICPLLNVMNVRRSLYVMIHHSVNNNCK